MPALKPSEAMAQKIPPNARPAYSANDNGPLSPSQVKMLKWAIAIMGALIVAALVAIFARVIYLSSASKDSKAAPAHTRVVAAGDIVPTARLALPKGANVERVDMRGNRLIVYYKTTNDSGIRILDLVTGKTISQITIETPAN